jgi:hypothetical protein
VDQVGNLLSCMFFPSNIAISNPPFSLASPDIQKSK